MFLLTAHQYQDWVLRGTVLNKYVSNEQTSQLSCFHLGIVDVLNKLLLKFSIGGADLGLPLLLKTTSVKYNLGKLRFKLHQNQN